MVQTVYGFHSDNLPASLPVFPLHGVMVLPGGHLPLNIFEPRYLTMFDDALQGNRLIGMIQPRDAGSDDFYTVGCAGKIVEFAEMPDGRYEVQLRGISRYHVATNIDAETPYRQIQVDWSGFPNDITADHSCLGLDRERLNSLLQRYFKQQEMDCDWDALAAAPDMRVMSCLAMTCPFGAAEKQALLEQTCCHEQAKMFIAMLEMELYT